MPTPESPRSYPTLTSREQEVMALIAQGLSNDAICSTLHISPKTLECHVARVFAKFDLPPVPDCHRRVCAVLAWLGVPSVRNLGMPAPPVGLFAAA